MSDYCKRCGGYSAEVGKPHAETGLCPYCGEICRLGAMIRFAIDAADWEPGDAQRALRELRDDFRNGRSLAPVRGEEQRS